MTPEHPFTERLGRLYSEDPRDKNFPMSAAMATVPTPTSKYWVLGPKLDQGNTPRCVGYATRQLLAASPHRYKVADPSADTIYLQAQLRDEWPGENYEGTSDRGAMKYLAERNIISVYRWAQSVEEACQYILTTGPILVGSLWRRDMFTTDSKGFIRPTGVVDGGHEYVCYGYNHKTWTLSFCNSWGASWGLKGTFKMNRTDFEHLIADQGDMCTPSEV